MLCLRAYTHHKTHTGRCAAADIEGDHVLGAGNLAAPRLAAHLVGTV